MSEKLDEADPDGAELLPGSFFAGHGSGPLVKPRTLSRDIMGSEVEIRLYKGKDGTKNIQGVLQTMEGESITVQDHDGKEWHLQLAEIAKAKLAVIF